LVAGSELVNAAFNVVVLQRADGVRAISEGRFEDAADLACSVRHAGELIAARPEFSKQYQKMHPVVDPRHAAWRERFSGVHREDGNDLPEGDSMRGANVSM
jgi:hypothetical protein